MNDSDFINTFNEYYPFERLNNRINKLKEIEDRLKKLKNFLNNNI